MTNHGGVKLRVHFAPSEHHAAGYDAETGRLEQLAVTPDAYSFLIGGDHQRDAVRHRRAAVHISEVASRFCRP